jgi:murein DD-endopeptidase MepM/ murein hydrolase activator NlpD
MVRPARPGILRQLVMVVALAVVAGSGLIALAPSGSAGVDAHDSANTAALVEWHGEQPRWVQLANQMRALGRAWTASGGPLTRPVAGVVTSGYGARAVPSFGEPVHLGVDFAAPPGAPVVAAESGVVVAAVTEEAVGKLVVIVHAQVDGAVLATLYGHLQDVSVERGQQVARGEQIGTVGSTGTHAMGPHLHFEVHLDGDPVDPADWL